MSSFVHLPLLYTVVTVVQFSHDDKTRLACASRDGTLTVFSLVSEPPSLAATLRGHTRAVNGESRMLYTLIENYN